MAIEVPRRLTAATDARLVGLVRDGDEDAFSELVARYGVDVERACRRVLEADAAQDAFQLTLMRALCAIRAGTEPRELGPWLRTIARNTALSQLSSGRDRPAALAEAELLDARGSSAIEQRAELRELLATVAALPARQRVALARAAEGHPTSSIAAELGVSETAARQLLHRARETVRAAMNVLIPGPLIALGRRIGGFAGRPALSVRVAAVGARIPGSGVIEPLIPRAAAVAAVAAAAVVAPVAVVHFAHAAHQHPTPALTANAGTGAPPSATDPGNPLVPASVSLNPLDSGSAAWSDGGPSPGISTPWSGTDYYGASPSGSDTTGGDPSGGASGGPQASIAAAGDSGNPNATGDSGSGSSGTSGAATPTGDSGNASSADPGTSDTSGAAPGDQNANSGSSGSPPAGDSGAAPSGGDPSAATPPDSSTPAQASSTPPDDTGAPAPDPSSGPSGAGASTGTSGPSDPGASPGAASGTTGAAPSGATGTSGAAPAP